MRLASAGLRAVLCLLPCLLTAPACAAPLDAALDGVVQPYVDDHRFSGAILIEKNGTIIFDKAYGLANAESGQPNRTSTRFHIGTLSMQYTAVVMMHLVEIQRVTLENTAGQFLPGLGDHASASIRDLLAVSPDSPADAADYEILARVAEASTARTFAFVSDQSVFASVWLSGSGIDDGTLPAESNVARGYAFADGQLKPASTDWRALAGAASVYTTTRDELHWLDAFFGDNLLTAASRQTILGSPAGFGWFHGQRLGVESYWMAGAAPGFASYVLRQPGTGLTVIVLSNVANMSVEPIGNRLAEAVLGAR